MNEIVHGVADGPGVPGVLDAPGVLVAVEVPTTGRVLVADGAGGWVLVAVAPGG